MSDIQPSKHTQAAPWVLGEGMESGPMFPLSVLPLAFYMAMSALRQEAKRTYLGVLWWVMHPIIYMIIYYFLIVIIFRSHSEDYIMYLLVGLTVWRWASMSIQRSANSIYNRSGLMRQAYFPKVVLPLSEIIHNTVMFIVALGVIVPAMFIYGTEITWSAFVFIPILMIIQLLFMMACGMFMSVLVPFFPDLRNLMTYVFQGGLFLSGVLWDRSRIPQEYQIFFDINPMATLIEAYRAVFIHGEVPNFALLWPTAAISAVVLFIALKWIAKVDRFFPKITI